MKIRKILPKTFDLLKAKMKIQSIFTWGRQSFLLFTFAILAFVVTGCGVVGPTQAQRFLEAINSGDREAANKFVCQEKQATFIDEISKKGSILKIDEEVFGLKSPGIKDIHCQNEEAAISCTYIAPSLLCSGLTLNDLVAKKPIKCTAFNPEGSEMTVLFEKSNGKLCDYLIKKPN